MNKISDHSDQAQTESDVRQTRRDFLKKAGKAAVYVPPAVMMLAQPSMKALAASCDPSVSDCSTWPTKIL